MGILDYLHPGDRDDLLDLIRNAAGSGRDAAGAPQDVPDSWVRLPQRTAGLPSPLDTAPWPVGPIGAPSETNALRRRLPPFSFVPAEPIFSPNQPSPLDTARWPTGPIGAPSSEMVEQNQPSPLDSARWPIGPVGAPSQHIGGGDEPSPLDSAPWPVGPIGAPSQIDRSILSPAPFSFVPAQLHGGLLGGTPDRSIFDPKPISSGVVGLGSSARPAASAQTITANNDKSNGLDQTAPKGDAGLAAAVSVLDGFPILGPAVLSATQRAAARSRSRRDGTSYEDELSFIRGLSKKAVDDHPVVSVGSGLAAGGLALAPFGMTATGAKLLGLVGGPLLQMIGRGAATGAVIGGADAAARGARGWDIAQGAKWGAFGGALGPPAGLLARRWLPRNWPEWPVRFVGGLPPRGGLLWERHSIPQQDK